MLSKIPRIGPSHVMGLKNGFYRKEAEEVLQRIDLDGIEFLFYNHPDFPERLRQFDALPAAIYYKGSMSLDMPRVVGIVGTRKPTNNGRLWCSKLIEELRPLNVITVSGLAYGIDACAHRASLEADIPTLAILGNGLKKIYPADHCDLARKIAENGGLISQFPLNRKAEKEHFPLRNHIIAALCHALIVVQSPEKGGSMITAEIADAYHRDVMAVPGSPDQIKHRGCNALIKKHKAVMIENADDLIRLMNWDVEKAGRQMPLFQNLDTNQRAYCEYLKAKPEAHIDELIRHFEQPHSSVSTTLLELECLGLLKSLPGSRFSMTH